MAGDLTLDETRVLAILDTTRRASDSILPLASDLPISADAIAAPVASTVVEGNDDRARRARSVGGRGGRLAADTGVAVGAILDVDADLAAAAG